MANDVERQILADGYRNAVVKLSGVVDSADVVLVPAVRLTDFINNDLGRFYALRVNEIQWTMTDGLGILLEWNSNSPQQIAPIAGRGCLCFEEQGGALPDTTLGGFDGTINLRTTGFPAGTTQNYTILLEMVKMYR